MLRVMLILLLLLVVMAGLLPSCSASQPKMDTPSAELSLPDVLEQLDALPVPENMDAAQWEALRQSMHEQLSNSGITKWVSVAPSDPANSVDDLYLTRVDDENAEAHWTYRNVGDYDQNSQVNISDLTPLGANLGKSPAAADWNRARVADGDENEEVNISDITPLGSHLLNTVDAYAIQSTFVPQIEASWVDFAVVQLSEATPAGDGPRTFTHSIPAVAGQSFRVVPLNGALRGVNGQPYTYNGIGGAPPMDPVLRHQVLDAIGEKFDNLTADTSEGQDEELAEFMASQPGITYVTHEEGVIAGTFEDGRHVIVFKNLGAPEAAASSLRGLSQVAAPLRTASVGLPQSIDAVLLNGFTPEENPWNVKMVVAARKAFDADSTYILDEKELTIENFRALKDVGVLCAAGHGGIWTHPNGTKTYILATTNMASPANDLIYADDLAHGAVDFCFAPILGGGSQKRYCLTSGFLFASPIPGDFYDNAITFVTDGFVLLPGCGGGHVQADDFRAGLFHCGAAVVIGWDRNVYGDQAEDATGQFFDGVLGTTTATGSIQSPPQRPFNYGDIMGEMGIRGVCAGVPRLYPPARMAHLKEYFNQNSNFDDGAGQLLPTITRLEVDEPKHQLFLYGDFGGIQPEVLVTGVPITIDEFQIPNGIFAHLDFSTGDQSMGYVQVSCDDRLSNSRKLSSWKGNVILSRTGPSSLHREVSFFVHFRADVDSWRNQPQMSVEPLGGLAHNGIVTFYLAPDSNAFVSCGGSHLDNDSKIRTSWSDGPHPILNMYYAESGLPIPDEAMSGYGQIDLSQNKVYLQVEGVGKIHVKEVDTDDGNAVISDGDVSFDDRIDFHWPPWVEMTIDPVTWDIAEGEVDPIVEEDITYSLHWEAIPCETGGPLLDVYSR